MKRYIKAFTYKRYNANPRDTNEGDCQTRAVALAFDVSYKEAGKMLGKRSGSDFFKSVWNVQYKLKELGCKMIEVPKEDKITVKQFSDEDGK